jgi:hypothetical protein
MPFYTHLSKAWAFFFQEEIWRLFRENGIVADLDLNQDFIYFGAIK